MILTVHSTKWSPDQFGNPNNVLSRIIHFHYLSFNHLSIFSVAFVFTYFCKLTAFLSNRIFSRIYPFLFNCTMLSTTSSHLKPTPNHGPTILDFISSHYNQSFVVCINFHLIIIKVS